MMTEQQILNKLTALCARGEHCKHEMLTKMERWEVEEETQQRVLDYLVRERFIDEERYARFFINDKVKYNRWGRRKVEQALYMKRIPKEVYTPILDSMQEESYEEILIPLLRNKIRSVKGKNDYEVKMKLIRFAMQRGFDYDLSQKCAEQCMKEYTKE